LREGTFYAVYRAALDLIASKSISACLDLRRLRFQHSDVSYVETCRKNNRCVHISHRKKVLGIYNKKLIAIFMKLGNSARKINI